MIVLAVAAAFGLIGTLTINIWMINTVFVPPKWIVYTSDILILFLAFPMVFWAKRAERRLQNEKLADKIIAAYPLWFKVMISLLVIIGVILCVLYFGASFVDAKNRSDKFLPKMRFAFFSLNMSIYAVEFFMLYGYHRVGTTKSEINNKMGHDKILYS